MHSSSHHRADPPTPRGDDDYITRVLTVPVAAEGSMTAAEALCILQLTERRAKWLLTQVHPDRHPARCEEATAATARVNQAMDVRSRGVARDVA